jgi:hypothetical protein
MAAGSPGSSARALRRSATVLQRSCWSLRRSVAAGLLPDAPSLTFGPLPGDHLSRDRGRGVATAASAGHPPAAATWEFPWLGRLWRPAVQRLRNTLVPVKNLRPNLNRMFRY